MVTLRDPEKELEEPPVLFIWPEVLREPVVTELVTVSDFKILMLPEKEEEPVPDTVALPKAVMLPEEAMVKIAVLALFMNCNDSEAAGKLLVDRRMNLCWGLLLEKSSKEAVPVVL